MSKNIINKKIMGVFFLIAAHSISSANCIKPIYSGENLWKLVARIGECLDDGLQEIESKVDAIQCASTPCEHVITQADIPYYITSPGTYCLGESVTAVDENFLIAIVSNDVILDLSGYQINGGTQGGLSEGAAAGVIVFPGTSNITIKNGTISNCALVGVDVGGFFDGFPLQAPTSCITLEDLRVLDIITYFPDFSNFEQLDLVGSTLDSLSAVSGFDKVLECCLGEEVNRIRIPVGIFIDDANHVVINNCQVFRSLGDGYYLHHVQDACVKNSQAYNNGGNGFVFDNDDVSSITSCKAEQNGFNGFYEVACNGDNSYKKCIAKQNGVHGFRIIGSGKTVEECIANQNTLDGFFVVSPQNSTVDGSLDITFGTGGKVTTDLGGADNQARAMVLQNDGKIVVAGFAIVAGNYDFMIVRYNTDGSLDTTFNGTGIVTTDFGGTDDFAYAVAIQEDGKIVAAGHTSNGVIALARYNPDGSLDTSFNGTGKVTTSINGSDDEAFAVAIQQDGKIVAAGYSFNGSANLFAVVRYNTNGSLDTTFNPLGAMPGTVTTSFGGNDNEGLGMALQADGKIVVTGFSNPTGVSNYDFATARYNLDGSLDLSFNGTGKVLTDIGASDEGAHAIAIQKDGKIVIAGYTTSTSPTNQNGVVVRYTIDGILDTNFNGTGIVIENLPASSDQLNAVAIQKDGKIVAAGFSVLAGNTDFFLVRYTTAGTLDMASFNPMGVNPGTVTTDFGNDDTAYALAIQKDGKLVAAGNSFLGDEFDFALARYNIFKRPSAIQDSIAMENGRDGFNILDAYKMTLVNNVAAANACNGFISAAPETSALDVITKNVGDNNTCADYSNIDAEIVTASAGEWVNIEL